MSFCPRRGNILLMTYSMLNLKPHMPDDSFGLIRLRARHIFIIKSDVDSGSIKKQLNGTETDGRLRSSLRMSNDMTGATPGTTRPERWPLELNHCSNEGVVDSSSRRCYQQRGDGDTRINQILSESIISISFYIGD